MSDRQRERVNYKTKVTLHHNNKDYQCTERNLSLSGAYFETNAKIAVNEKCGIEIELEASAGQIVLNIESKIIRIDDTGIAVTFESMDSQSFEHLKKIIMYNSSDPKSFIEDCHENPGFK